MATSTSQISAPEPFDCSKSEEWPRWIRRFERFRTASGLAEKSEESQVNTLIYCMGDVANDIVSSFKLTDDQLKEYNTVKEKFNGYRISSNRPRTWIITRPRIVPAPVNF